MPAEGVPVFLSYRVVNRISGAEIIGDLAHLHQSRWEIRGLQPGASGGVAVGTFSIPLPAPLSDLYGARYYDYKQLLPGSGEGLRIEGYKTPSPNGATPAVSGIITNVTIDHNSFVLSGYTDAWVARSQRPFPGEQQQNAASLNSGDVAAMYLAENILSYSDQFNPYTSGNYTSTNQTAFTSGTWTGTTDANGINSNVVTCSTGTGAILISKTGAAASKDGNSSQFVEVMGRLLAASGQTVNAGSVGVGLSQSSANAANCLIGYVTAKYNSTTARYDLDAHIYTTVGPTTYTATSALTSVDPPDRYIPLRISLLTTFAQTALVVNGAVVLTSPAASTYLNPGATTYYPLVYYSTPAAGTANAYMTNLIQGTRSSASVASPAPFAKGTFGTAARSLRPYGPLPPSFLDIWTMAAQQEGWLWRYTPARMTVGSHTTMGTVDMSATPGTDLSAVVRFEESGNLMSARIQGNAEQFAADLQLNGIADSSSGGIGYARNLAAMTTYGWLSDVGLSLSVQDWNGLNQQGGQISANKGSPGASYSITVLRDPFTADRWRELDYVTLHTPSLGVFNAKLLILSYTLVEGDASQTLTLGQYGQDDFRAATNRMWQGVGQIAGLFKSR